VRVFFIIWKIWFSFLFVFTFLILFPFFYVFLKLGQIRAAYLLKIVWAYVPCWLSGLFPVVIKEKKFKWPKKAVIVANHSSYLDIALVPFYCKKTSIFMAKYELLKIPLFNIFFHYMDIPVNRKSITDAHRAFVRAGEELDKERNVIIFPEGTISPNGVLKPFKDGAFLLAIRKQVPLVPVVYRSNWKHLQNGGFFKAMARPGFPEIYVGKPVSTVGMEEKDAEQLKETIRNFMLQKLEEKKWK